MLDLHKEFAINLDAEKNGKWISVGKARFLIARAGNDNYNKVFIETFDKNSDKLSEGGDEADALSSKLVAEIMAKTILLGWEGEVGFKGKVVPYSVKNATEILADPEMKEFRKFVTRHSENIEHFRAQSEEEQEKN